MARTGRWLLLFALAILSATPIWAQGIEGKTAPDFTLKDIDGDRISLADLTKDGPVLLDFWATWCVPCKQAMPKLAEIHEDFEGDGFQLVAISIDNTRSLNKVKPYVRSQGYKFPVLLDTDSQVLRKYRGTSVPHTVLVTQEGTIAKVWIGYHPGEEKEIRAEITALLEGGAGD
ncbi:redoxin domain-containing protein [bacterium]|nr:redoxin domain-containing protein [bacterium]